MSTCRPSVLLANFVVAPWFITALIVASATSVWAVDPKHPLDGLTEQEHWTIFDVMKKSGHLGPKARFIRVLLKEPAKTQVLEWREGGTFSRAAELVIRDVDRTFEATIDLQAKTVTRWKEISGVHSGDLWGEVSVSDAVKGHAEWQAAMKKRGITDFDTVEVWPISLAFPEIAAGDKRRLWNVASFDRHGTVNVFGRPIEGLIVLVDVDRMEVLSVTDTGPVPVPDGPVDFDETSVGKLRDAPAPLITSQPRGPGFELDGHQVRWQNWQFHFRIDPRVGIVISQVHYLDEGRPRSILYQGYLSELFVPYMDPSMDWAQRAYLDLSDNAGGLAVPLQPGLDCPDYATFFETVVADGKGIPKRVPRAACLFELDPGSMAWRHWESFNNVIESRKSRQLVLRMIATLGNYDYVFDWIFQQNGAIRVRVGSTGIDQVKSVSGRLVRDGADDPATAFGRYVAPHTVAVNHDHYFCFRLDLDVDGVRNSFLRERLKVVDLPEGSRRSRIWVVDPSIAGTEKEAQMKMKLTRPVLWRFINPRVRGAVGNPVSYHIRPMGNGQSLVSFQHYPGERGGFTENHLWVTPWRPDERYAGGKYPLNRQPDGLVEWTKHDRPIEETDIVAWYTLGFHHVVRVEDWPVMPTKWDQFELRPYNFFDRNPALDLPK